MKNAAPEKCEVSKLHCYYTFTVNGLKATLIGDAFAFKILAFTFVVNLLIGASL